jgi:5-methylthioribose kinase
MFDPDEGVPLDGGVASDVRIVDTPDGPLVVKKALAKLKVAADWVSDPSRSLVEVAAIEAFGRLAGKETVPQVVWARPDQHCFAMRLVDPRLRNWKSDLLDGRVDLATAARVGEILGLFHSRSAQRPELARQFDDLRFFHQLRVAPFFEHVAAAKPEIARRVRDVAHGMLGRRQALVHGDYSPKNILADGGEAVILDFEVAHWGDPRFDVAFCLSHLMLKSALSDSHRLKMTEAIRAFLAAYRGQGLPVFDAPLAHLTGCLLLARLFGKSPVDYVARLDLEAVEARAAHLLTSAAPPQPHDFTFPELRA